MQRRLSLWPAALAAGLLPLWALAAAPTPEQQLTTAVDQLREGKSSEALKSLETLTRQQPNFRLAHLLYGELLAALSGSLDAPPGGGDSASRLDDLAEEARVRLASEKAVPPDGFVPNAVLKLASVHKYLISV